MKPELVETHAQLLYMIRSSGMHAIIGGLFVVVFGMILVPFTHGIWHGIYV